MVIGGTKVVQVTNIAPQATKDQMQSLFGYLGKIEDIRLYPTLRDVSCPVQSRICYIKFVDPVTTGVAQHMTNTVFIDRALIVLPMSSGEIPDEYYALEMTKNGTIVPGLCLSNEPKLPPNVTNSISGIGQEQVILTSDPLMESKGLAAYPPLPANYDCGKIEEIRRTLLMSNLLPTTTADDIMRFFQPIGEIKYLRSCTRVLDSTIHWLVEFSDQHCISDALSVAGTELNGKPIKITHATQSIVKPQTKTNEAAQREIEEAMSRVKEAQSLISAAIDPVIGMLSKDKERNSSRRSRSRSRGRRRRSSRTRSRSRSRRSRSGHRSSRRRSRSRSRGRRSSRSKDRVTKRRSRSRKRSKSRANRSRSPSNRNRRSKSPRGAANRRDRDRKRSKSRDNKRSKSRDRREKDRKSSRDKSKDRRSRERGDTRRKLSRSPSNRKSKTPPPLLKDSSSKGRSRSPKDRKDNKKDPSVEKSRSRSHSRRSRSKDRGGVGRDREPIRKDECRGRSKRSRTSSPRTVSRRRSPGTPIRKDRDRSRSRDRDRHSSGSSKRDEKRKDRSRSRSKVTPRNYEEEEKASSYDSVERKLSAESDRESEPSIAAEPPENHPEEKESDNMDISNSP